MALFKILKGNYSNLSAVKKNEGYCYLTNDENIFYIDKSNNERIALNERAYKAQIRGDSTNNYKYRRIAKVTNVTDLYDDRDSILLIRATYNNGPFAMLRIGLRTNSLGSSVNISATWLYRPQNWFTEADSISICEYGVSGDSVSADVYLKCWGGYPRAIIE